jgi:hypothetical protein
MKNKNLKYKKALPETFAQKPVRKLLLKLTHGWKDNDNSKSFYLII